MTDKMKQAARQVQEQTSLPYRVCSQLVGGQLVWTAKSDACLVAKALATAKRWAEPKPGAAVKPCRCAMCAGS